MMRVAVLVGLVAAGVALAAVEGAAMEYFVSEKGNDAWSGTLPDRNAAGTDGPFRTLGKAAGVVAPGDICTLRAGVYRETLRPAASGQPGKPILFRAYPGETAVLSGADALSGWAKEEGGVYSAPMAWDLADGNQLFAGETMLTEARWPNNAGTLLQPTRAHATAGSPTTLTDPNIPGDAESWKGASLWCAGGAKWICWTGPVTGFDPATKTLTFDCKTAEGNWYTPKAGSEYVLMGARAALDTEGEWWFDRERKRVLLIPPGAENPEELAVEAKRRAHVIDLSGRSHVHVVGLRFRAGSILTDDASTDLLLKGLQGEYVAHSYAKDVSESAVLIKGSRNMVHSCEFAYASGSVLAVRGSENRVINCYVHDGNYGGKWSGTVSVSGRRHVVSHCTFRHSGRDLMSIHGLAESIVQYNDLSDAGWLTHDLGMTYGHNTDFANTVIHHNWVHDNQAKGLGMGIYFDHLSHNVIVHSNLLWNVTGDAIRINNPSYFDIVANNTCYRTNSASKSIGTFDHSRRQDLYAVRWYNNLFNVALNLANAVVGHNQALPDPGYADPEARRFELKPDSPAAGTGLPLAGITPAGGGAPDPGAFQRGAAAWRVGHDFADPPQPDPVWSAPDIAWMNLVRNACFETGNLDGWEKTDAGKAQTTTGNGWGNHFGGNKEPEPTGTSKHELRLGGGVDGVQQRITGLKPDTSYTLSAWARVSAETESVSLGVKEHPEATAATNSTRWTRLVVEFKTGPGQREATVFLRKTSDGPGHAWCDNVGLPKTP